MSKLCDTGDKGQRYEIRCADEDGFEMVIGWSDDPRAFSTMVALHPCYTNHVAVDRTLTPDIN